MQARPQQKLHAISLNKRYWPESFSVSFLNMTDKVGNPLALFESDYTKFQRYLSVNKVDDFTHLSRTEKFMHLARANVRIIRYYADTSLHQHELDITHSRFTSDGEIISCSGIPLKKNGHQNCVVFNQGKIYIHPKIRPVSGRIDPESASATGTAAAPEGVIGVSHSSLCHGATVPFAGSFIHDVNIGWIVENTTGHYSTRAYQLIQFLETLARKGIDLSSLTVKTWVPHNPKQNPPSLHESDYDTQYENAAHFLARVSKSKKHLDHSLFKHSRVKRSIAALDSPTLDSSDYILLAASILTERLGHAHEEIRTLRRLYLAHHYADAKQLIQNLCIQHVKRANPHLCAAIISKASNLRDNPLKNESRRYFEASAARLLTECVDVSICSSVEKFKQFLLPFIPASLNVSIPALPHCVTSLNDVFSFMRTVADENKEILHQHDAFRATSAIYKTKDRGEKIKGQQSIPSMCPGIMRSVSQMQAGDKQAAETDRIADLFTIASKPNGFSSSAPDFPFVNSISGSAYTLIFMLEKYMKQNQGDPALEADVNHILSAWFISSWFYGYHSFHEMMAVFNDPVVTDLFKRNQVQVHIESIAEPVLDKAFAYAAQHMETFGQKMSMLASITFKK